MTFYEKTNTIETKPGNSYLVSPGRKIFICKYSKPQSSQKIFRELSKKNSSNKSNHYFSVVNSVFSCKNYFQIKGCTQFGHQHILTASDHCLIKLWLPAKFS